MTPSTLLMITNRDIPVAGVRYYMVFAGEVLDVLTSGLEALASAKRNPGMKVEAEVWRITDPDNGVEEVKPRVIVYPAMA